MKSLEFPSSAFFAATVHLPRVGRDPHTSARSQSTVESPLVQHNNGPHECCRRVPHSRPNTGIRRESRMHYVSDECSGREEWRRTRKATSVFVDVSVGSVGTQARGGRSPLEQGTSSLVRSLVTGPVRSSTGRMGWRNVALETPPSGAGTFHTEPPDMPQVATSRCCENP